MHSAHHVHMAALSCLEAFLGSFEHFFRRNTTTQTKQPQHQPWPALRRSAAGAPSSRSRRTFSSSRRCRATGRQSSPERCSVQPVNSSHVGQRQSLRWIAVKPETHCCRPRTPAGQRGPSAETKVLTHLVSGHALEASGRKREVHLSVWLRPQGRCSSAGYPTILWPCTPSAIRQMSLFP